MYIFTYIYVCVHGWGFGGLTSQWPKAKCWPLCICPEWDDRQNLQTQLLLRRFCYGNFSQYLQCWIKPAKFRFWKTQQFPQFLSTSVHAYCHLIVCSLFSSAVYVPLHPLGHIPVRHAIVLRFLLTWDPYPLSLFNSLEMSCWVSRAALRVPGCKK